MEAQSPGILTSCLSDITGCVSIHLDEVVAALECLQNCYSYKAPKRTAMGTHMQTQDKETICVCVCVCVCKALFLQRSGNTQDLKHSTVGGEV